MRGRGRGWRAPQVQVVAGVCEEKVLAVAAFVLGRLLLLCCLLHLGGDE